MLYTIIADRNDGLNCGGTIEAFDDEQTMRVCKKVFRRTRISKSAAIVCPIHNDNRCRLHGGEYFTFTNHEIRRSPVSVKVVGK